MVTGLAPNRVKGRVVGWALRIDPRHVLLAERLLAGGYETAGFVCCNGFWGPDFRTGLQRGLEHYAARGAMNIDGRKGTVNYQPSRIANLAEDPNARSSNLPLAGTTQQQRIAKTLNFQQAGEFYRALPAQERDDLIANLSGDLKRVKNQDSLYTMLSHFWKADADYGRRLAKAVGADGAKVATLAAGLKE